MKKITLRKKVYLAVLIGFLVLTSGVIGFRKLYESNRIEISNQILEKVSTGGISLTNSIQFYDENDKKQGAILLALKPGEKFEGSMIAKNHYDFPVQVHFATTNPKLLPKDNQKEKVKILGQEVYKKDKNENVQESGIEVKIRDNPGDFILQKNEIREFDYFITTPATIENGTYRGGDISLIESNSGKAKLEGNEVFTFVAFGAAVTVRIDISDNPQPYKTEVKLGKKVSEIIDNEFKIKLKFIAGALFFCLSIIFIYFGIKSQKKGD